ncbi:MAG: arginine deiminase-related protein [Planctomycetota bacterium]|nr:arginine deiminase-related protein [Planctomycetota bacterium]MDA1214772.1 arginine deiminase-related protein [Planctomycetota bacterium]
MTRNVPTILMCPPDFFGIEYEINPWMSRSRQSDTVLAQSQWQGLHDLLVELGVQVELMPPQKGLPDLVFTANAGLIWYDTVFLPRFRHAARQGEVEHDRAWFSSFGLHPVDPPGDWKIEGAGDALFCGETLFAGYLIRSDVRSMQWVAGEMNCRVIPLQLVHEHFYHLDTCFCPLDATTAVWFPEAFDEYGRRVIAELIPNLIAVVPEEAGRFACNAVVVGRNVVHNTGCPVFERSLREIGFTSYATPLDEFIKSGGSAKCLTLRLDGEEAAIWTRP